MSHVFTFILLAAPLPAAVVYSGVQNIPIPTTFAGVYVDIDTETTSTTTIPVWDINPFFGGVGISNSATFQPARTGTGNFDVITRLGLGAVISSSLNYSTGVGGSGDPNTHLGPGTDQFSGGAEDYLGFRLTLNDTSGPFYGWMRVTLTANTSGAFIHDWAWDNTGAGITSGTVPEPESAMLTFLWLCVVAMRRRRLNS
ncbi:MAG: hypothetical protein ACJA16_004569 [Akkermansiaceae bacterium]|jgi:hypothetical protein